MNPVIIWMPIAQTSGLLTWFSMRLILDYYRAIAQKSKLEFRITLCYGTIETLKAWKSLILYCFKFFFLPSLYFYGKDIKVSAENLESYLPFWLRSEDLPKWDITIIPT
jgi:hypothetical protein